MSSTQEIQPKHNKSQHKVYLNNRWNPKHKINIVLDQSLSKTRKAEKPEDAPATLQQLTKQSESTNPARRLPIHTNR